MWSTHMHISIVCGTFMHASRDECVALGKYCKSTCVRSIHVFSPTEQRSEVQQHHMIPSCMNIITDKQVRGGSRH